MKRIWFDIEIGTNPDVSTALLFTLLHPEIEVVGISLSGSKKTQPSRHGEALEVLKYINKNTIPIFLGEDITPEIINDQNIEHTIISGPLTNISKLYLDDAILGKLHINAGCFSKMQYRGKEITQETNAEKDLEATRIVLTQAHHATISSLEATSLLVLDDKTKSKLEDKHRFLKKRYDGYQEYLSTKYNEKNDQMIFNAILPLCDILNTVSINKENVEFKIQADGTFFPTYQLSNITNPIEKFTEDQKELTPVPTVCHEVIRAVNPSKVFEELLRVI